MHLHYSLSFFFFYTSPFSFRFGSQSRISYERERPFSSLVFSSGKKKQSGVRNCTSKRKKRFRGTQKQNVAVKKREETPSVEVTLVGEDDVVNKKKFLSSAGSFQAENTVKRP